MENIIKLSTVIARKHLTNIGKENILLSRVKQVINKRAWVNSKNKMKTIKNIINKRKQDKIRKAWNEAKDVLLLIILLNTLIGLLQQIDIASLMAPRTITVERTAIIMPVEASEPKEEEKAQVGEFTAYNSTIEQCGKEDGITASGKKAKVEHTLACPPEYKFGTEIEIEGLGVYTCEDRGGAIKGNHFDIYFGGKETVDEAFKFGKQYKEFKIRKEV